VPIKLHIVHGSHPCNAVAKAMELKGIPFKIVELPPPLHAPIQQLVFGERTVPAIRFENGEKLSGSRAIMRRLEQIEPQPALYPADPELRAKVEEAERWGEEEFQSVARRLIWSGMKATPEAISSYTEGSKIPLPKPLAKASGALIARAQMKLNKSNPASVAADLAALPGQLDRIDGYIADGVIGGEAPNAADLQIASTVRLLMTLDDLTAIIEPRPAGVLARRLWPHVPGKMPQGSLPTNLFPVG